jgi:hypothetical protein
MRRRLLLFLAALTIGTTVLSAQAPSDLVVVVPGTKQFHQPGCAVVARAGSGVKVMKRADAVRKGLTAHDCRGPSGRSLYVDPNTIKVYTQPGDNKYHVASCAKLGATRTAVTLEEAGRKFWPCPVCHPPIRQAAPHS